MPTREESHTERELISNLRRQVEDLEQQNVNLTAELERHRLATKGLESQAKTTAMNMEEGHREAVTKHEEELEKWQRRHEEATQNLAVERDKHTAELDNLSRELSLLNKATGHSKLRSICFHLKYKLVSQALMSWNMHTNTQKIESSTSDVVDRTWKETFEELKRGHLEREAKLMEDQAIHSEKMRHIYTSNLDRLEAELARARDENEAIRAGHDSNYIHRDMHEENIAVIRRQHAQAMHSLQNDLVDEHHSAVSRLKDRHGLEMSALHEEHKRKIRDVSLGSSRIKFGPTLERRPPILDEELASGNLLGGHVDESTIGGQMNIIRYQREEDSEGSFQANGPLGAGFYSSALPPNSHSNLRSVEPASKPATAVRLALPSPRQHIQITPISKNYR